MKRKILERNNNHLIIKSKQDPYNLEIYNQMIKRKESLIESNKDDLLFYNKYLYDNPNEEKGLVPFLTNKEYDNLLYSLNEKDQSKLIGTIDKGSIDTTHDYPLLRGTLSKANFIYDNEKIYFNDILKSCEYYIDSFYEKLNLSHKDELPLLVSLKYDGISLILTVKNHTIIKAVTRGTESKATDLTHVFGGIIDKDLFKYNGGYKVELLMTDEQFMEYKKKRKYNYSNPRVAVSSLCRLDNAKEYNDLVTFKVLSYESDENHDRLTQFMEILKPEYVIDKDYISNYILLVEKSKSRILDYINNYSKYILHLREKLNFPIDGIVIELVNSDHRNIMGRDNSINKFEFALKFESNEKETIVEKIDFTVGRTGKIVPRVWYQPITFFGNIEIKTSISSINRFNSLNLGIGDTIKVSYNNDVLTYIPEVIHHTNSPRFQFPTICPACGSQLVVTETGKESYCVNEKCKAKIILRLVHFLKKMGIENYSDKTIELLFNNGFITIDNPYVSLFELDYEKLIDIEGIGEITAYGLKNELDNLIEREISDLTLLESMGIPTLGNRILSRILCKYNSKELYVNRPDITKINGIGEKVKTKLYNWLDENYHIIIYLYRLLNITNYKDSVDNNNYIYYCTSGFRPNKEIISLLESNGLKYKKSLTKDCKYLLVKDLNSTSNTISKANDYNIPIYKLESFLKEYS